MLIHKAIVTVLHKVTATVLNTIRFLKRIKFSSSSHAAMILP